MKLSPSYWSVKLFATGLKSCSVGNSKKWQYHSKHAISCSGNSTYTVACPSMPGSGEKSFKGSYETSEWYWVHGFAISQEWSLEGMWSELALPKGSMIIQFIKNNHPFFLLVFFWQFLSFIHERESHSVASNSLWPHGLYSPCNSLGQNTGVGSLSLLQRIFPNKWSNPGLPHCRKILYQLSHKGSPRILEWVAYPSPANLLDPGIELGSPAWQADSLPTEI